MDTMKALFGSKCSEVVETFEIDDLDLEPIQTDSDSEDEVVNLKPVKKLEKKNSVAQSQPVLRKSRLPKLDRYSQALKHASKSKSGKRSTNAKKRFVDTTNGKEETGEKDEEKVLQKTESKKKKKNCDDDLEDLW